MAKPENRGQQQADTRFKPGQSGNPSGRPKGARHRTTVAIEALLEGEGEALTRKAIELAKAGDMQALRLCMDRLAPPRRDFPGGLRSAGDENGQRRGAGNGRACEGGCGG